jgi:hypothetical protein
MSAFYEIALAIPVGARRVLFSHCPACGKLHDSDPHSVGSWNAPDNFTRSVVYGLCRPCGLRMGKAGKRGRKRIVARIEKALEEAGVLDDIRKEGLQA